MSNSNKLEIELLKQEVATVREDLKSFREVASDVKLLALEVKKLTEAFKNSNEIRKSFVTIDTFNAYKALVKETYDPTKEFVNKMIWLIVSSVAGNVLVLGGFIYLLTQGA